MHKCLLTLMVLIGLLHTTTYAASTQYYLQYKETYSDIATEFVKLQNDCQSKQDPVVCEEAEVFGRNLIAKKIQAFGEYFELVSSTFLGTFPEMQDEGLTLAVDDVRVQVTALKFSAVSFKPEQLEELEKTTNVALKIHADLADFLSVNYHYYRLQKLYLALNSTHARLDKEVLAAKKSGLNTTIAEKELNGAASNLKEIKEKLKTTAQLYEKGETSQITRQVKQNLIEIYTLFIAVNTHMLKASTVLVRLSDTVSWEVN